MLSASHTFPLYVVSVSLNVGGRHVSLPSQEWQHHTRRYISSLLSPEDFPGISPYSTELVQKWVCFPHVTTLFLPGKDLVQEEQQGSGLT